MTEPTLQTLDVNGLRMQVAIQGSGPLVLLCHGFPELWISWRAQLAGLAAAGYRAVAPDMRGYGGTTAPEDPTAYTLLHLVGDIVELVKQLEAPGEKQAVIVGHDWGAPVAWNSAMLRPDLFRAVVGMSVPFSPPGPVNVLEGLRKAGINTFYMQYFQTPGVAEAELERDVAASIRRINYNGSGDGPDRIAFGLLQPNHGFLDNLVDPETLPSWLSADDVAYFVAEFSRTGFRGGPQIANFTNTLPGLRGCHIIEGAGHWIQRERASAVNDLLIKFLKGL